MRGPPQHRSWRLIAAMLAALPSAVIVSVPRALTAQAGVESSTQASWDRCMLGISYGAPLKMAVSYARGRLVESLDGGHDACHYASSRLGIGGARLALGSSRTINALGGGAGISVGVLRTFGSPLHAERWRNYAGAAVHVLPALAFGGEFGYFVRLGDDAAGAPARRIFTWSFGFGF